MKKVTLLTILSVGLPIALIAQSAKPIDGGHADRFGLLNTNLSSSNTLNSRVNQTSFSNRGGGVAIWSEDFDGAVNTGGTVVAANGTWSTSGGNGDIWKYSMTQSNGCWSFNTPMPDVTTASNGFLLFDADSANCVNPDANPPVFNQNAFTGTVVSPVIDLSLNSDVILSFEYQVRHCCSGAGLSLTLEISGDGGATWPSSFEIATPAGNVDMHEFYQLNVSNVMGGMAQAMFRLTWSGQSHYFWIVDDFAINAAPANDVQMSYAAVSHNGTAEEYGRIPIDQLHSDITLGAGVFNFGSSTETNVSLDVDFSTGGSSVFTGSDAQLSLSIADTVLLGDTVLLPTLTTGVYLGEFTVTSDDDNVGGPTFGNNVLTRNFEVTDNLYSIDGIGIHDVENEDLSAMGTSSFPDSDDGLMILNYYDISTATMAVGLEIVLGNATLAGGSLVAAVHDTANVFLDEVTLQLEESDIYDITAQDTIDGIIQVMFLAPVLLQPNAYYVGVELFSNSGDNVITILDDVTVPQPGYSTMIYSPDDNTVYGNGNAAAIRLITADPNGLKDVGQLTGVSIYPNPTKGVVNVRMSIADSYTIEVMNVLGEVVHSSVASSNTTIDLNEFGVGVYVVKVSNEESVYTEKVIVQ